MNRLLRGHYSSFIALTDSFANPHLALPFFGYSPRLRSLRRLLPAPAASGTFPTLCCESFLRCLSPYPGGRLSAFAWFFLNLHRPSPSFDWVDFPASFREHDFSRVGSRGCSYFIMFRPPSLLASQIVPTAASFPRRAAEASYIRAERASLPSHASDILSACCELEVVEVIV